MAVNAQQLLPGPGPSQGNQKQGPGGKFIAHKNTLPDILLGTWLLFIWVMLQMLDIETTEAWLLKGKVTSFSPDWAVLLQIPSLVFGQPMSIDQAKADMFAWTIALATLTLMVCFEKALDAVSHANHHLTWWYGAGCVVMGFIDLLTNFAYAPGGLEGWKQFIFALVISFGAFFFGVPGYRLIEHGFKTWRHA